ncbi:MAG: UDP-2,3-diacylglucosamine diphosphatase, partial [Gammaproteobacteria bacterium]
MATYFIADLHLNPPVAEGANDDATSARFMRFCQACATDLDALYILGDLFEVWIGDDAGVAAYQQVVDALSHLAAPVYILHGNRDFLLSDAFCQASGARLLADPSVINVDGQPILIAHGDAFCTDDSPYQQ